MEATANAMLLEMPPPGDGFNTVINTELGVEKSVAGMVAVSFVLLMKTVFSPEPFHSTMLPGTKFDPFMVKVNVLLPIEVFPGNMELMLGVGFCVTGTEGGGFEDTRDEDAGLLPPQFVRNTASMAILATRE